MKKKRKQKPPLTLKESLARIPEKPYLTTSDVQHVMNDCHEVSVYRWIGQGKLKAYRVAAKGKSNVYRREDVVAFVRSRYQPRPRPAASSERTVKGGKDGGNESSRGPKRKKGKAKASPTKGGRG